jgi:DNA recombination protein RmuC
MTVFWVFGTICAVLGIGVLVKMSLNRQVQSTQKASQDMESRFETLRRDWSSEFFKQNESLVRQMNHLSQSLAQTMNETRSSVQTDLKNSGDLMANIHNRLGELSETSKRIHDVGENIAGLQELLRAPKLRGGMGEYFLEDLLGQIIPKRYFKMQHVFASGCIVDAVIQIGEAMVCVDSKFPLESFNQLRNENDEERSLKLRKELRRCVKKHVDDISEKYILPAEGTYDFALMYVPAESVYYETIIRDADHDTVASVFEYAVQKKVIPVSPNSIYAYLQVILIGLKGFEVESRTKEILNRLSCLKNELLKFESEFNLVGKHLMRTNKKYEDAQSRLVQFGSKVQMIEVNPGDQIVSRKQAESVEHINHDEL